MAAVWLRFRAELRRRWRAWLALALLVGVAAGVVMALVAGARRTDTAYERFLREQRAFDAVVFPEFCPGPEDLAPGEPPYNCDITAAAELSPVRESAVISQLVASVFTCAGQRQAPCTRDGRSLQPGGDPGYTGSGEVSVLGSLDGRYGTVLNRLHILEGRLPDPDAADEVAISKVIAERAGVDVGDRLRAHVRPADEAGKNQRTTWHVVGIVVAPFEVQPGSGEYLAVVHVTPAAFQHALDDGRRVDQGLAVRLAGGDRGVDELSRQLEERRIRGSVVFRQSDQAEAVERGIEPDAVALALVAALAGLAVTAVFGSGLGRQAWAESADSSTLWSLGLRRRQLVALTVARGAATGAIAAPVAVVIAVLLSPLMPIGLARDVEPAPGLAVDGVVLAAGAGLTIALVVALVLLPAWRIARAASPARAIAPAPRSSSIAAAMTGAGFPPAATIGARMALDPGRGGNAVPVRTGYFGVTAGVLALAAALGFSAGLGHLTDTPRLVGWNWDAVVQIGRDPTPIDRETRRIARLPGAASATAGTFVFTPPFPDHPLLLGPQRTPVELLAIGPGAVGPSVIEGRAAIAPDEIVLGTETLDDLGLEIGDRVRAVGQVGESDRPDAYQDTSTRLRVVGTAAILPLVVGPETAHRLGRGAITTIAALRRLNPVARPDVVYVRLEPGADRAAFRRLLHQEEDADRIGYFFGFEDDIAAQAEDALPIQRIDELPLVLAGLVAVLAAGVLAHVLVTSVRTRRRDFAVLRALGFRRRQLRGLVAWHATTVAVVALVVGLPAGAVVGRRAWEVYAGSIGVVPESVVSWLAIAMALVGGLIVASVVAVWPARAAARTQPALVLRSE